MFRTTFHMASGDTITAEVDREEVERFIAELLALPDISPGILDRRPSEQDVTDREGQLQLTAVAFAEFLRRNGTLAFLGEHARSVIVRTEAVTAVEVTDPDAAPARTGRSRIVPNYDLSAVG